MLSDSAGACAMETASLSSAIPSGRGGGKFSAELCALCALAVVTLSVDVKASSGAVQVVAAVSEVIAGCESCKSASRSSSGWPCGETSRNTRSTTTVPARSPCCARTMYVQLCPKRLNQRQPSASLESRASANGSSYLRASRRSSCGAARLTATVAHALGRCTCAASSRSSNVHPFVAFPCGALVTTARPLSGSAATTASTALSASFFALSFSGTRESHSSRCGGNSSASGISSPAASFDAKPSAESALLYAGFGARIGAGFTENTGAGLRSACALFAERFGVAL
mmetsp:Transcript_11660/g.31408  ORF Transcript_11660/g.31408 Transcript_11660/m.31408 type:complete len:285 (-) Transcript_11660:553-1407(-)